MSRGEVEMALLIVRTNFGPTAGRVAEVMHLRNGCTLQEILRHLAAPPAPHPPDFLKVRNAVAILIQHNAVRIQQDPPPATSDPSGGRPPPLRLAPTSTPPLSRQAGGSHLGTPCTAAAMSSGPPSAQHSAASGSSIGGAVSSHFFSPASSISLSSQRSGGAFSNRHVTGGAGSSSNAMTPGEHQYFLPPPKYHLRVTEILYRMRFPQFLLFAEKKIGILPRHILFQLLKLGRCNIATAVKSAIDDPNFELSLQDFVAAPANAAAVDPSNGSAVTNIDDDADADPSDDVSMTSAPNGCAVPKLTPDALKMAFVQLVAKNLLAKVPPTLTASNFLASPSSASGDLSQSPHGMAGGLASLSSFPATAGGRKRAFTGGRGRGDGTKRRRGGSSSNAAGDGTNLWDSPAGSQSVYGEKDVAVLLGEASAESAASGGSRGAEDGSSASSGGIGESRLRSKAEREELQRLSGQIATFEAERTVFCANFESLNLELAKLMVEDLVAMRFSDFDLVRYSAKALLTRVRRVGASIAGGALPYSDIEAMVEASVKQNGGKFQKNNLLRVLDALGRHADRIIRSIQKDSVSGYHVDWPQAREVLIRRVCFNAIKARFGSEGARVWSLMSSPESTSPSGGSRFWEDQKLGDTALLPPQNARTQLYNLSHGGLSRMQMSDVSSHGAGTASAKQHSLVFAASPEIARQQILSDFYETALRMWHRKQSENERVVRLYLRVQTLSEEEEHELHNRERGEDLLELNVLKLENSILIIRDLE